MFFTFNMRFAIFREKNIRKRTQKDYFRKHKNFLILSYKNLEQNYLAKKK